MPLNTQDKKLYELKAGNLAAAGHPIRLAIIDFLKDGEQCVCRIVQHVQGQRSNVSRHLTVLLWAGIVEHRKEGLRMIYSLRTPCIVGFLSCVDNVLRRKLEADRRLLKQL